MESIKICADLKHELSLGIRFQIHSSFQHAINLQGEDGSFCSLLAQGKPLAPKSVLVPFDNLRVFGDKGSFVRFDDQYFHFESGVKVDISKALPILLKPSGVNDRCLSILSREIHSFINHYPVKSFFQNQSHDRCLMDLVTALQMGNCQKELKKIVGCGNGLTPSGDDFCVGLAWVLMVTNDRRFESFVAQLNELSPRTTDISAMMFHNLQQGLFIEPLVKMGSATSSEEFNRLFSQVATIGHSSGMDTLYGLRWGLAHI